MKHRHSDRLVATICGLTILAAGGLLTTGSAFAQSSALPTTAKQASNQEAAA